MINFILENKVASSPRKKVLIIIMSVCSMH